MSRISSRVDVRAPSILRPRRPPWFRIAAYVAAASMLVFLAAAWQRPWQPGRAGGLVFGTLAALAFVVDALYPLRRRLLAWPLATAQTWLQLHIYAGLLACLFVWIHIGFRWPAGQFGWWLLGLSMWTGASGLLGVFLQKWIPLLLTGGLRVEAIYERVPELVSRLRDEADALVTGGSEALERVYLRDVRPALEGPAPSWAYLLEPRRAPSQRLTSLTGLMPFVEAAERERVEDLQAILSEKIELDAHVSLQRVMRLWLLIHVPPAMALMGLLAVHVFAVLYF
jgi:hypothetical protein